MNARISTALAAAVIGLAALAIPATGHAEMIGHYGNCYGANAAAAISASGHTPVNVAVLDAPTLATLDGLMVGGCAFAANAAVNNAVANGLVLIVHDEGTLNGANAKLPGTPSLAISGPSGRQIDFPLDSPVLSGPGGTLTNASLDEGSASTHGSIASASLPAGSAAWATTDDATRVVTFTYAHGSGRVVYSTIPLYCYLPGGNCSASPSLATVSAGMQAYAANMILAAVPLFVSCADEGFTGSKLTLCRQVCEIDQTPTRLTSLIKLYMTAYRSEPPCAR